MCAYPERRSKRLKNLAENLIVHTFMQKVHQTREERASDYNDDIPVVTDSSLFHLTGITKVQWSIASSYEWKSIQALLVTEVVAGQGAK